MSEPRSRSLRVAMVWSQAVCAEQLLSEPRPVVLGYGPDALFPLPEAYAARGDVDLLTPIAGGYALHLPAGARGAIWIAGARRDVRELLEQSPSLTLARGDYGVVSLGAASYFFQHVQFAPPARRGFGSLDADAVLSFGLSLFVHACVLILMLLAERELPRETTLAVKPELVTRMMAIAPPDTLREEPKERAREDEPAKGRKHGGGERAARAEGKLGRREAKRREHAIEGERRDEIASKVRGLGVLGALAGGDSLRQALAGDQVSALLSGLDGTRTELGAGSGGRGLRGVGSGGGGDGPGSLFGAGALGTGLGQGRNAGGSGGKSAAGGGRAEAKVQLSTGAPEVSGYLSAEQVDRVVRANQAALRYCYESEVQRQRGLRGKVVLQWRVDREGSVPSARVASSSLKDARVEGCLLRQVRKWRFPKPDGGEVSVMYPFIFGVGG